MYAVRLNTRGCHCEPFAFAGPERSAVPKSKDAAQKHQLQPVPDTNGSSSFRASDARPGVQEKQNWIPAFAGMTPLFSTLYDLTGLTPGLCKAGIDARVAA